MEEAVRIFHLQKESEEALKVFQEWTKAFQAGDYEAQWYKNPPPHPFLAT